MTTLSNNSVQTLVALPWCIITSSPSPFPPYSIREFIRRTFLISWKALIITRKRVKNLFLNIRKSFFLPFLSKEKNRQKNDRAKFQGGKEEYLCQWQTVWSRSSRFSSTFDQEKIREEDEKNPENRGKRCLYNKLMKTKPSIYLISVYNTSGVIFLWHSNPI